MNKKDILLGLITLTIVFLVGFSFGTRRVVKIIRCDTDLIDYVEKISNPMNLDR